MHRGKNYSFPVPPAKADTYSNPYFPEKYVFLDLKDYDFG
jgi:hypothetical protein